MITDWMLLRSAGSARLERGKGRDLPCIVISGTPTRKRRWQPSTPARSTSSRRIGRIALRPGDRARVARGSERRSRIEVERALRAKVEETLKPAPRSRMRPRPCSRSNLDRATLIDANMAAAEVVWAGRSPRCAPRASRSNSAPKLPDGRESLLVVMELDRSRACGESRSRRSSGRSSMPAARRFRRDPRRVARQRRLC